MCGSIQTEIMVVMGCSLKYVKLKYSVRFYPFIMEELIKNGLSFFLNVKPLQYTSKKDSFIE